MRAQFKRDLKPSPQPPPSVHTGEMGNTCPKTWVTLFSSVKGRTDFNYRREGRQVVDSDQPARFDVLQSTP